MARTSTYTLLLLTLFQACQGFVTPSVSTTTSKAFLASSTTSLPAVSPDMMMDVNTLGNSMMLLAETEPWVQPLANVLDPTLNILSFAMLCRVVISWYPTTDVNSPPFNIVVWPTEPLLKLIRGAVPPAFGVDISPIVWLGVFTFLHEIFLGQQGLLMMKIKYGI